jgi:hypothetical protein
MEYQTLPFPPPPFFLEKGCRNKLRKITRMRTTLERWGNHTMCFSNFHRRDENSFVKGCYFTSVFYVAVAVCNAGLQTSESHSIHSSDKPHVFIAFRN